jgi:CheY-like chemotaxis protein
MITGLPIFVVEDGQDVLNSIREVLEDAGFVVTTAGSGEEALLRLRQIPLPAAMLFELLEAVARAVSPGCIRPR